ERPLRFRRPWGRGGVPQRADSKALTKERGQPCPRVSSKTTGTRMKRTLTRRASRPRTATTAAGLWLAAPQFLRAQSGSAANDKLNIGVIGVGGQGGVRLRQLKGSSTTA